MFEGKRIGAILLMGGEGKRFESETPKQFHLLGGKKVFCHSLEAFRAAGVFDEIILVCHRDWMVEGGVAGGATRQQSSFLGLKAFQEKPDIVLIHDAVRPFVTERILRENVAGAIQHGAVDTCISSADTLVYAPGRERIERIPRRGDYLRGQTPQTFRYDWIVEGHESAVKDGVENATDDCQLVLRLGRPVHVVSGDERNIKITTALDLFLAEIILQNCSMGYTSDLCKS